MKKIIIGCLLLICMSCTQTQIDQKASPDELSFDEQMLLTDMYIDEVGRYLTYLNKFLEYRRAGNIDSMTIYNDSCDMSYYAQALILNKRGTLK